MSKKFELTEEFKMVNEVKVFRIKALKDFDSVKTGDFGGWLEKDENLSQEGDCWVYANAKVYGGAKVSDNARVYDNAWVHGNASVYGNARVYDNAWVYDNAKVCGDAEVCGNAWVYDNAQVSGDADYLCFKGLGSYNRNTTFFKCKDGHIHVSCGCFSGDLTEFKTEIEKTHGESKFAKEYLICIEVAKIHFELENIN